MDFWYEDECAELAHSHRASDPRARRSDAPSREGPHRDRLRDSTTRRSARRFASATSTKSSCCRDACPIRRRRRPSSTAASSRSKTPRTTPATSSRIRILDVDDEDDYVLAEMVTAGASRGEASPRRRRAEISAAEQTRQLRELAEEAARQSASRPPIGITSVTEEEEAQDKALQRRAPRRRATRRDHHRRRYRAARRGRSRQATSPQAARTRPSRRG